MAIRSIVRCLAFGALYTALSMAAPLTIVFDSSLAPAAPGQTVTYTATVTNTTAAPVFLNSDALNIAPPLVPDDTKFFLNFPAVLAAGEFVHADIFDIAVPAGAPLGLYSGHFDILGGSTAAALGTVGSADFAAQVVPEPATLALFMTGGLVLRRFRAVFFAR